MARLSHLVNGLPATKSSQVLAEATKTPEMRRIEALGQVIGQHLQELHGAVNALQGAVAKVPTRFPKPAEQKDYTAAIDDLKMLIARIPGAVPKPEKVDIPDYSAQLAQIAERVANIRMPDIPEPEKVDLSGVQKSIASLEQGFDDVLKAIAAMPAPKVEKAKPSKWRFNLSYSDIDGEIEEITAEPV